ncbi:hypothetical protein ACO0LC_28595 [Undibacterium sp. JH2W]|uniref:hypothetical protein n=1 Tax=Undibacterium sp. JH2W TaxID=3413037 RepID=UPI003BF19216
MCVDIFWPFFVNAFSGDGYVFASGISIDIASKLEKFPFFTHPYFQIAIRALSKLTKSVNPLTKIEMDHAPFQGSHRREILASP